MIEHKLSNNNQSATVLFLKKIREPNQTIVGLRTVLEFRLIEGLFFKKNHASPDLACLRARSNGQLGHVRWPELYEEIFTPMSSHFVHLSLSDFRPLTPPRDAHPVPIDVRRRHATHAAKRRAANFSARRANAVSCSCT
jgi:hypothetical protein